MAAVADLADMADELNSVATNASLDPADRVAELRRLRDRIGDALADRPLLGQCEMYIADLELQREGQAAEGQLDRARLREDADVRDLLVARGIATDEELVAAGWPGHDDLDRAAEDGSLVEGALGMFREGLHPRDRKGEWRDKPGIVKMHGRGGGAVSAAAKPASYQPPHPAVTAVHHRWGLLTDLNKAAQDVHAGDPSAHSRFRLARAKVEGAGVAVPPEHHTHYMHHVAAAELGALPPEPVAPVEHPHEPAPDRHATDSAVANMFRPDETAKPKQTFGSAEALFQQAEQDFPAFQSLLTEGMRSALDASTPASLEEAHTEFVLEALANSTDHPDKPQIVMGPMKKMDRAREKVDTKYDGDWDRLQDVLRATVVVPSLEHMPGALEALRAQAEKAGWKIAKAENRYADDDQDHNVGPTPAGYRDAAVALVSPGGIVSELQINTAPMFAAKQGEGHHMYEESRSIEAGIKQRMSAPEGMASSGMASPGGPTADEAAQLADLAERSKRLYNDAWEASYVH